MNANIKSDLLITLNRAGRNVLAYIIDEQLGVIPTIHLNKVAIAGYFAKRISPKYGSTVNAARGIDDLVKAQVIDNIDGDIYQVNTEFLKV